MAFMTLRNLLAGGLGGSMGQPIGGGLGLGGLPRFQARQPAPQVISAPWMPPTSFTVPNVDPTPPTFTVPNVDPTFGATVSGNTSQPPWMPRTIDTSGSGGTPPNQWLPGGGPVYPGSTAPQNQGSGLLQVLRLMGMLGR